MAVNVSFVNDGQAHSALEWANYFSKFITNGVFSAPATALLVTNPSGRTLNVEAGTAFVDGVQVESTTALTLTADATPSSRMDRVVVRVDQSTPEGGIFLLKGTDGSTTPPTLANTGTRKELCLADVLMDVNGVRTVTDRRASDLCGIAQNFLGPVDASGLFANYEAEFNRVVSAGNSAVQGIEDEAESILGAFMSGKWQNALVNGDFKIDQRGGGTAHSCTTGQRYTLDRWLFRIDGAPSAAMSVQGREFDATEVANQPVSAVQIITKAIDGAGMASLAQFIENGIADLAGGKVTVAFKAYAQTAQKLAVNLRARYTATDAENILSTALDIGPAWKDYAVTFEVPRRARDASNSIKVSFFTTWAGEEARTRFGTSADNNAGNVVYIAEARAIRGANAIPFSPRLEAEEMQACRRYYRKTGLCALAASPMNTSTRTVKAQALDFSGMRAAPTVTVTDKAGTTAKASWEQVTGGTTNGHGISFSSNNDGFMLQPVVQPASPTQVQAASIIFGSIEADAEVYA